MERRAFLLWLLWLGCALGSALLGIFYRRVDGMLSVVCGLAVLVMGNGLFQLMALAQRRLFGPHALVPLQRFFNAIVAGALILPGALAFCMPTIAALLRPAPLGLGLLAVVGLLAGLAVGAQMWRLVDRAALPGWLAAHAACGTLTLPMGFAALWLLPVGAPALLACGALLGLGLGAVPGAMAATLVVALADATAHEPLKARPRPSIRRMLGPRR